MTDDIETAVLAERKRCLALCEGWIGVWGSQNPKFVSAQKWATDAIQDIAENIEKGIPFPPPEPANPTTEELDKLQFGRVLHRRPPQPS
jgi:hypothetical protein